jgi:leucyl-tRNA synthetase
VWNLVLGDYRRDEKVSPDVRQKAERELSRVTHQTIRKVTEDLEKLHLNTMISALMEFTNYLARVKETGVVTPSDWEDSISALLRLLAPTTPHLAEELWQKTGNDYSIHNQNWPQWDKALARDEEITLVVQVNGKLRDRKVVPASTTEVEAKQIAAESTRMQPYLEGKEVAKVIYVPGVSVRLINFVVK